MSLFSTPTIDYHLIKDVKLSCCKVAHVLNRLKLKPSRPVINVIKDKTMIHYADVVSDANNRYYFIKIKLFQDRLNQKHLYKNRIISRILTKNPFLRLNRYTPRLIDAGDNYLLYEYVEGINLGARQFYNVVKAKLNDIPKIAEIIQAVLEFPTCLLPRDFEKHGWDFLIFHAFNETKYDRDKNKLAEFFTEKELLFIDSLRKNKPLRKIVDDNTLYLSHSDFKPSNLVKTTTKINVVDWDLSSVSIKYFDLVKFYMVSYRKPYFRKLFFKEMLKKIKFNDDDKMLLSLTLFSLMFHEVKILMDKLEAAKLKKTKDFNVMTKLLARKIIDTKYYLQELFKSIS